MKIYFIELEKFKLNNKFDQEKLKKINNIFKKILNCIQFNQQLKTANKQFLAVTIEEIIKMISEKILYMDKLKTYIKEILNIDLKSLCSDSQDIFIDLSNLLNNNNLDKEKLKKLNNVFQKILKCLYNSQLTPDKKKYIADILNESINMISELRLEEPLDIDQIHIDMIPELEPEKKKKKWSFDFFFKLFGYNSKINSKYLKKYIKYKSKYIIEKNKLISNNEKK